MAQRKAASLTTHSGVGVQVTARTKSEGFPEGQVVKVGDGGQAPPSNPYPPLRLARLRVSYTHPSCFFLWKQPHLGVRLSAPALLRAGPGCFACRGPAARTPALPRS